MLTINDLDVFHGELQVLRKVTLKVDKGEIVAIVGSNGAGKTTLLEAISGVLNVASGEIVFLDKKINSLPIYKRVELGISLVPEGKELFRYMTVLENLKIGAYSKEAWKEFEQSREWVYQLFPKLKEREKQKAGTLSGGEQQMVAIGKALMSRAKLLMVDELSSGLAPNLVTKIVEALGKMKKAGTSILLVEQNVHEALETADRGYVLQNGRIILEGEGRKLLDDTRLKEAYLGI